MRLLFYAAVLMTLVSPSVTFAGTVTVLGRATVSLDGSVASFDLGESGSLLPTPFTFVEIQEAQTAPNPLGSSLLSVDINASYVGNKVAYDLEIYHDAETSASNATFDINFLLSEDWELKARSPTSVLPSLELFGTYSFSARGEYSGGGANGNAYDVSVFTGIDFGKVTFGQSDFLDEFSGRIDTTIGVRYGVAGQSQGSTAIELVTSLSLPGDSIFSVFSGDSLDFTRIAFADGTTPEDHGFDFVRSSGRISPNLAVVPEPSSWAILCAGFVAFGLRRKRA